MTPHISSRKQQVMTTVSYAWGMKIKKPLKQYLQQELYGITGSLLFYPTQYAMVYLVLTLSTHHVLVKESLLLQSSKGLFSNVEWM